MSANKYNRFGVRTYRDMQRQSEIDAYANWVEVEIEDDAFYQSFGHPAPSNKTIHLNHLNTNGSISEVPGEPKKIKIEMEHTWKSDQQHPFGPSNNKFNKFNKKPMKESGVTGTDLELMFIFGFGGCFACWMLIMMVQIFMNKVVL